MKVTKKVGRRSRKYTSSISRRRFRNNKNKKNSYKKRYGKTHRGGCWKANKGGARSRKYGHKRGKRFHRGGVNSFGDEDIVLGSELPPTIAATTRALGEEALPEDLRTFINKNIKPNALNFEYKRTDGIYAVNPNSETGLFDVVITKRGNNLIGIYLLRRDKNDTNKYDKRLYILNGTWTKYDSKKPFTGIEGYLVDSSSRDGTYTFPSSDTNQLSFDAVKKFIADSI